MKETDPWLEAWDAIGWDYYRRMFGAALRFGKQVAGLREWLA